MKVHDSVHRAYRSTFGEYSSKLEALQRLLESNGSDSHRLEAAVQDLEKARKAHSQARDLLARELGVKRAERAVEAVAG